MNNLLEYKGYFTRIEYSAEDNILYGKIEGIRDLVNFESDSAATIEEEFHQAVDDYLQFCEETGVSPDKAYSGTFNVRIKPELHRDLATLAAKNGDSLNTTVEKAIRAYISPAATKTEQVWAVLPSYETPTSTTTRATYLYGNLTKTTKEVIT